MYKCILDNQIIVNNTDIFNPYRRNELRNSDMILFQQWIVDTILAYYLLHQCNKNPMRDRGKKICDCLQIKEINGESLLSAIITCYSVTVQFLQEIICSYRLSHNDCNFWYFTILLQQTNIRTLIFSKGVRVYLYCLVLTDISYTRKRTSHMMVLCPTVFSITKIFRRLFYFANIST